MLRGEEGGLSARYTHPVRGSCLSIFHVDVAFDFDVAFDGDVENRGAWCTHCLRSLSYFCVDIGDYHHGDGKYPDPSYLQKFIDLIVQRMGEYETLKERRLSAPLKRPPGLFPLPAVNIFVSVEIVFATDIKRIALKSSFFSIGCFLSCCLFQSSFKLYFNQAGTYGPTPDNSRQVR